VEYPDAVAKPNSAPPTPVPTAIPSTLASCIAADASPSRPSGAEPSATSVAVGNAMPIPMPAIPQVTGARPTIVDGDSTDAVPAIPTTMSVMPIKVSRRWVVCATHRSWIQVPVVQHNVAAVSVTPATNVDCARTAVSASGT